MAQRIFYDGGYPQPVERRMNQTLVVDNRQALWGEIALLLAETEASVTILTLEDSARYLRKFLPRLMVVGEESYRFLNVRSNELIQLIVSEEIPAGRVVRSREGRNVVRLGWPADREFVLTLIDKMLTAARRYSSEVPISVISSWEENGVSGKSEDFSVSGMSFRSPTILEKHDDISVEFNPKQGEKELYLNARVVRCSYEPDGGPSLYGVMFLHLSDNLRGTLNRFVSNLRESQA